LLSLLPSDPWVVWASRAQEALRNPHSRGLMTWGPKSLLHAPPKTTSAAPFFSPFGCFSGGCCFFWCFFGGTKNTQPKKKKNPQVFFYRWLGRGNPVRVNGIQLLLAVLLG